MIELNIDTQELSEEFSLSQAEVDGLLQYNVEQVTVSFTRQWEIEAKNGLSKSRNTYINAIQVRSIDKTTKMVYLNPAAWLANAIEMGAGEFDMKKGFLNSDKVKYTSKGKPYITIPFRFASSDAIGESSAFAGVMPKEIHQSAKQLKPKQQLNLSDIPKQYQIPQSSALRKMVKNNDFSKITNKTAMTSIYQGLSKKKSGYVAFRRVSLATDSDRWIHPGFTARDFAGKALAELNIPSIVDISIDNYLNQLGF